MKHLRMLTRQNDADVKRTIVICSEVGGKAYVIGFVKSKLLCEYLEDIREIPSLLQEARFGELTYSAELVMHLSVILVSLQSI